MKHMPLSQEASLHHQRFMDTLQHTLFSQSSTCSFADYMHHALYAPGLGYYNNGFEKFGSQGDFITAPELSPLFAQCLAVQCEEILSSLSSGNILELGPGSGILAAHLLLALEKKSMLPQHYYLLEVSPPLRQQQENTLRLHCPHLLPRIHWLHSLPQTPFQGVVIANEVLDAMPVHLFRLTEKGLYEQGVKFENHQLQWALIEPPSSFETLQPLLQSLSPPYESEINFWVGPWLQSIYEVLEKGILLLIDYGFTEKEYYHPQRNKGTLMCHYQHHAHGDPFLYGGLQDITAHVDFSRCGREALQIGWELGGFCNQAHFLLSTGLMNLRPQDDIASQFDYNQQIKKLTLPHEMGELFKVMALTKHINQPLVGFTLQDWRRRL